MGRLGSLACTALTVLGLAAAAAAAPPTHPHELALSAEDSLYVGNATLVALRIPAADPRNKPTDIPVPVASNGAVLLDERVVAGTVLARRLAATRLLAEVVGDVIVTQGKVDFAQQAHVHGDVLADTDIIVGISSLIEGDITSVRSGVRIVRLAHVLGDVYARREFRGDRDVQVGSPGTTVEVKGNTIIRDRGEYFGAILHEGPIAFQGVGEAILHAGETRVGRGVLQAPAMIDWKLSGLSTPDLGSGGGQDVTVDKGTHATALPPGQYRRLLIEQRATVRLSPGLYVFDEIDSSSDARMLLDLAGTAGIEIRVKGNVQLGRRFRMDLVTRDEAERQRRASLLLLQVGGELRSDQDAVLAGTILARKDVNLGRHTTFTGAAWSGDDLHVGRDSLVVWAPYAGTF